MSVYELTSLRTGNTILLTQFNSCIVTAETVLFKVFFACIVRGSFPVLSSKNPFPLFITVPILILTYFCGQFAYDVLVVILMSCNVLDRPRRPQHKLATDLRRDGAIWFFVRYDPATFQSFADQSNM